MISVEVGHLAFNHHRLAPQCKSYIQSNSLKAALSLVHVSVCLSESVFTTEHRIDDVATGQAGNRNNSSGNRPA